MCTLSQNGYGDNYYRAARHRDNLALSPLSSCPLLSLPCSPLSAPQLSAGPPLGPFPRLTKLTGRALRRRQQLVNTGRGGGGAKPSGHGGARRPARMPARAERQGQSRRALADNLLAQCAQRKSSEPLAQRSHARWCPASTPPSHVFLGKTCASRANPLLRADVLRKTSSLGKNEFINFISS